MKIGIICFWDRHATPYLAKYEAILKANKIEFDIIFWNRSIIGTKVTVPNEIQIDLPAPIGIYKKIFTFLRWRAKAVGILKIKKYDYLIVLSTYPAVLLISFLIKYYKNKYIFDIRDYSQESFRPFKKAVMRLINASRFTTISSKGFYRWLDPSEKIIVNHNITYIDLNYKRKSFFRDKNKINITFVGNVRLDGQTRAMMINMKNSVKYTFGFVGRMLTECDLDDLCQRENITNVFRKGAFIENDKPELYANIDIVNAVYANDEINLRLGDATPLPNRVYDTAIFKCPIVASKGTYLAELIDEYNLGFAVNGFDNNIEKDFDKFLCEFNQDSFLLGCERFIKDVMLEENNFRALLKTTLLDWKHEIKA